MWEVSHVTRPCTAIRGARAARVTTSRCTWLCSEVATWSRSAPHPTATSRRGTGRWKPVLQTPSDQSYSPHARASSGSVWFTIHWLVYYFKLKSLKTFFLWWNQDQTFVEPENLAFPQNSGAETLTDEHELQYHPPWDIWMLVELLSNMRLQALWTSNTRSWGGLTCCPSPIVFQENNLICHIKFILQLELYWIWNFVCI